MDHFLCVGPLFLKFVLASQQHSGWQTNAERDKRQAGRQGWQAGRSCNAGAECCEGSSAPPAPGSILTSELRLPMPVTILYCFRKSLKSNLAAVQGSKVWRYGGAGVGVGVGAGAGCACGAVELRPQCHGASKSQQPDGHNLSNNPPDQQKPTHPPVIIFLASSAASSSLKAPSAFSTRLTTSPMPASRQGTQKMAVSAGAHTEKCLANAAGQEAGSAGTAGPMQAPQSSTSPRAGPPSAPLAPR